MAMGSLLITPTSPIAAAVVSEPTLAPTRTPWFQSFDSYTNGANSLLLPPKTMAEIGTPFEESARSEYFGLFLAETVNLELG